VVLENRGIRLETPPVTDNSARSNYTFAADARGRFWPFSTDTTLQPNVGFRGIAEAVGVLRYQESTRIAACQNELVKLDQGREPQTVLA
jgi:hypothetical protein